MNNPWNINNNAEVLFSPSRTRRIVFRNMSEFAMGGPLSGDCFILEKNGSAIYIGGSCGCPAVWSLDGRYVALPIWSRNPRCQRLAVVDLELMELRLSVKTYSVVELAGIEGNMIMGNCGRICHPVDISRDYDTPLLFRKRPLHGSPFDIKGFDNPLWFRKRLLCRTPWPYFMFDDAVDNHVYCHSEEGNALKKQNEATCESASTWIEKPLNNTDANE